MTYIMKSLGRIADKLETLNTDSDVDFICMTAEYEDGTRLFFDVDPYGIHGQGKKYAFGGNVASEKMDFDAEVEGLWFTANTHGYGKTAKGIEVCDGECNTLFAMPAEGMRKLRISANIIPWGEENYVFSGYNEETGQYAREEEYETSTGDYA